MPRRLDGFAQVIERDAAASLRQRDVCAAPDSRPFGPRVAPVSAASRSRTRSMTRSSSGSWTPGARAGQRFREVVRILRQSAIRRADDHVGGIDRRGQACGRLNGFARDRRRSASSSGAIVRGIEIAERAHRRDANAFVAPAVHRHPRQPIDDARAARTAERNPRRRRGGSGDAGRPATRAHRAHGRAPADRRSLRASASGDAHAGGSIGLEEQERAGRRPARRPASAVQPPPRACPRASEPRSAMSVSICLAADALIGTGELKQGLGAGG